MSERRSPTPDEVIRSLASQGVDVPLPTVSPSKPRTLRRKRVIDAGNPRLAKQTSLPRPTAGVMSTGMADVTREEIDAKIAAAEARNETSLTQAMGEVRAEFATISQKLTDVRDGQRSSFWGTAGLLGASVAAILAALAFGNDMFSRGFDAGDIAQAAADKAVERQAATMASAALVPPCKSGAPTCDPSERAWPKKP